VRGGRLAALAALMAAIAGPADAAPRTVWERAAGPEGGEASYRALMAKGDQLVERAAEQVNLGETQSGRATQLALRAVEAYEKAAALRPKAAEPHYRAAEVLSAHFVDEQEQLLGDLVKPAERAIAHWDRFERLAPRDPRIVDMLFRRSIALTKLGGVAHFKRAAADYDAALRLEDAASANPLQIALLLSNAAEIHMASGDLERAIELYSDSLDYNPKELYGYGLVVALDRDGQATKALEMMQSYGYEHEVLFPDPRKEAPPFFVPDGDVHWYQSIGMESKGDYQSAYNHMQQFLSFQPKSPYVARARERMKTLEAKLRRSKGKKPPPAAEQYRPNWEMGPVQAPTGKDAKPKPKPKPRKKSK
jgi:tetratricopeptide (TPR) repeat protein